MLVFTDGWLAARHEELQYDAGSNAMVLSILPWPTYLQAITRRPESSARKAHPKQRLVDATLAVYKPLKPLVANR